MRDTEELFDLATQAVRPDPGALERQHRGQRWLTIRRKMSVFVVVGALIAGAAVLAGELTRDAGREVPTSEVRRQPVFSVPGSGFGFSADGNSLMARAGYSDAHIYRADTGQLLRTVTGGHGETIVAFSATGSQFATIDPNGRGYARVYLTDGSEGTHRFALPTGSTPCCQVSFSPDGSDLAVMGRTASGARTFLFDLRTRELANTFDAGGAMAFSPDGRRLVISGLESGSEPGVGYVVDTQVPGGAPLALTGSEAGDLGKPAWSPEGSMLATATGMGKVIVWDAGTGIRRFTIVPADGRFEAVAFSPDSRRLATASTAGTAIVWALSADGVTKMLTLTGNDLEAVALSFSPDGTRLMMGGVTTTRVWDVTP